MRRVARIALAGGTATTLILSLSGCGVFGNGLYNLPLPGGADLGSHPYSVTAQFANALDLVPQAGVRVNDVAVGRVTSISLEPNGKIADVVVKLNGSVHLPANAIASIQQTSLLGEKYVELGTPSAAQPEGTLHNGAMIDLTRTTTGVEVEQVFGALSLLLNGGGIGQLHEIAQELNQTTGGHEIDIRRFFDRSQQVIGQLNRRRGSITRALDGLANLSSSLRRNNTQIAQVLNNLSPGLAVVAGQESQLRSLLVALDNLSTVTVSTLARSRRNIVADFRALAPILGQLARAGSALPRSLQVLLTYPFTDGAVNGIKGDFLNAFVTTAFNTPGGSVFTANAWPSATTSGGATSGRAGSGATPTPTTISAPPALLPATTSAGSGLPSSLPLNAAAIAALARASAPSAASSSSASAAAAGASRSGSAGGR